VSVSDLSQGNVVFRVRVGSARYESSGKLHKWIPTQGQKGTLFSG